MQQVAGTTASQTEESKRVHAGGRESSHKDLQQGQKIPYNRVTSQRFWQHP